MLDRFRAAKSREIALLEELDQAGVMPPPFEGFRPSMSFALRSKEIAVIAEYKRASPSRGDIELGLPPADAAQAYRKAGARALSVLTEETYFKGKLDFLEIMAGNGLPLLRKDFIFHPLQIRATAATPASALLLIARMVPGAQELKRLMDLTVDCGMEPVVEVFDYRDLEQAKLADARIIQVNNRDLDTLRVDMGISSQLVLERMPDEIWISASGFSRHEELAAAREMGFDAVLVGTSLMSGGDPGAALARLIRGRDS